MRRAATYLTSVALLSLLSPFAMAKADATQVYRSGVQLVAVNNYLPQPTIVASPRSATHTTEFSPATYEHSFFDEFYTYGTMSEALASASVPAPKRSMWAEQRARLSPISGVAKKLVFNFLRR
jgi:hypothetical protein